MRKRNGEIDFWKFIMSVIIVLYHGHHFTTNKVFPFFGGALAVEFFFLVSGYLMAASLSKKSRGLAPQDVGRVSGQYLWHKFAGLYPDFLIAWLISFVVVHLGEKVSAASLAKDGLTGVWELLFLRSSGLTEFRANAVTWYISAMFLAMLILVPLFLWNRELFLNIIAPAAVIFILGFYYQTYGNLRGPVKWAGFTTRGVLRATAELCLGCLCYRVTEKLRGYELSFFGRLVLTLVQYACYLSILAYIWKHCEGTMEYVVLMLFAVAVTLTFTGQGLLAPLFQHGIFHWLGNFSLSLFLCHSAYCVTLGEWFPEMRYRNIMMIYVALVFVTALFVYGASTAFRRNREKIYGALSALFLKK